jgi:hypothetical protein
MAVVICGALGKQGTQVSDRSCARGPVEGVEVDNTRGSLIRLAEVLWTENAFKKHKRG